MSHPSERWNYAREIDKQFNHSRFKNAEATSTSKKFNEDKKASLLGKLNKEIEEKKETPAEKLRRKMRQQLNKQSAFKEFSSLRKKKLNH